MPDPYRTTVATSDLDRLSVALDVVDQHAELNHRYRKLLHDSRQVLASSEIRLTQARGVAKKLLVLVKAAGPAMRSGLRAEDDAAVDAGLAQADDLIRGTD